MVGSATSRRRVYLSCRAIFSGNNAQIRRLKKVQELVRRNKVSLQPLLDTLGGSTVISILRDLLEDRIFESELRAKMDFPELFRSSTIRDVQRQASEAGAAVSIAEALDDIASQDDEELDTRHEPQFLEESEDGQPALVSDSLKPETQHLILNTAQQVLEASCFNFATQAMPQVLQEKGWNCSAAVELTQWTKLFRKGGIRSYTVATDLRDKELLKRVSNLRHTAVHRLPTTARGISQLLGSAKTFAQHLHDDLRAAQLEELQSDVDSKIKAMELNKNVLEDTVASKLHDIQRQREELDRMETKLTEDMIQDDLKNKALIGQLLEDSVHDVFQLHRAIGKEIYKEGNEENDGEKDEDEGEDEMKQVDGACVIDERQLHDDEIHSKKPIEDAHDWNPDEEQRL